MHTPARVSQCWSRQTQKPKNSKNTDSECARTWSPAWATAPALGRPTPGVVKRGTSSGGSVDTTKAHSDPQRVGMCKGKRPMGAAKGKQTNTMASCQTPPSHRHRACGPLQCVSSPPPLCLGRCGASSCTRCPPDRPPTRSTSSVAHQCTAGVQGRHAGERPQQRPKGGRIRTCSRAPQQNTEHGNAVRCAASRRTATGSAPCRGRLGCVPLSHGCVTTANNRSR